MKKHKNSKISLSLFVAILFSLLTISNSISYKENTKSNNVTKSTQTTGTENWGTSFGVKMYISAEYDIDFEGIVPYAFGYEGEKSAYSSYLDHPSPYGHDSFFRVNYNSLNGNSSEETDEYGSIVGGIDYYATTLEFDDKNDSDGIGPSYKVSEKGPGYNIATDGTSIDDTQEIFSIRLPNYVSKIHFYEMNFDLIDHYYDLLPPTDSSEYTIKWKANLVANFTSSNRNNPFKLYYSPTIYNDVNFSLIVNPREIVLNFDYVYSYNYTGDRRTKDADIITLNSIFLSVGLTFNNIDLSGFDGTQTPEISVFNSTTAQAVYTLSSPIGWNGRGDELETDDYDDNGLIIVDDSGNVYPFTTNGNQITITGLTPGTTYNMKFMQYENPMNLLNEPNNVSFYEIVPGTSEFVLVVDEYDFSDPFGGITGSNFGVEMIDQTSATFQLQSTNGLTFQSGDQIILSDDTNGLNYTITFNDPLDYTDVTLSSPNISWSYSGGPTNPEMSITVSNLNPNSSYQFDIKTQTLGNEVGNLNTYSFYTDYEDIDNTASTPISASTTSTTENSISGTYTVDLKGRNYDDYNNLVILDQNNNNVFFPDDKFTLTNPSANTYNYQINKLRPNYQISQISLTYRENRDQTITNSSIYTQTINISLDDGAYTIFEKPVIDYSQLDFTSTSSTYEMYFEIEDYGSFINSLDVNGTVLTPVNLFENVKFEKYSNDVWTEINLTSSEVITINYDLNFDSYYILFDRNQLGLEVEQIRVFLPYYDRSIVGGGYNYDYSNPDYVFDFTTIADINSEKTTVIYDERNNVAEITLNGNLHGNIHSEDFFLTYTVFDEANPQGQIYTDTYRKSNNVFIRTEKQDDSTINYVYYIYNLSPGKTIQIQEYGFKTSELTITYNEFATSSTFYTRYRGLEGVIDSEVKLVTKSATSFSFEIILTDQQLETSDFDGTQIKISDGKGNEYYPTDENVDYQIIEEPGGIIFYYTVNNLKSNTNYGDIYIDIATEYGAPVKQNGQYIYGYSFNIGNVTTLENDKVTFNSWKFILLLLIIVIIFILLILFVLLYSSKKSKQAKKEYQNIIDAKNASNWIEN